MLRYFAELIDQGVAMLITLTMALTLMWPFMEDGFWASKLVYLWIVSWIGVVWVFLPIILAIIKAAYKDWRRTGWK